jgi:hypothetical protein
MSSDVEKNALSHSLKQSLLADSLRPGPLPKITVLADPLPKAYVAPGALLISRGFLSLLNESELRAVLRQSYDRLQTRGIFWSSLCARWAEKIESWARAETKSPTPQQVLIQWLVFPIYYHLKQRSVRVDVLDPSFDNALPSNDSLRSALSKAKRVTKIHSNRA